MSQEPSAPASWRFRRLQAGEPAPWFKLPTLTAAEFNLDVVAGRYLVLCFFGTSSDDGGRMALSFVEAHRTLFDDDKIAFFGVTCDPTDLSRVRHMVPGIRFFLDFEQKASQLYGASPMEGRGPVRRLWAVLDPALRVIDCFPAQADGAEHGRLATLLEELPPVSQYNGLEIQAPVLFLPNVFEPELCEALIATYDQVGGQQSGFMRDVDGKTTLLQDANHKIRSDVELAEADPLRAATVDRITRRIIPRIEHAYQFTVTRIERYLIGCYRAEDGGHFRAHRDNTSAGTAHRRFAVSINLNADFEGGEIGFPEYGPRTFKPPPGGAVVFSCGLLHQVDKVTQGQRYAFLPFLYDEAAAAVRQANLGALRTDPT